MIRIRRRLSLKSAARVLAMLLVCESTVCPQEWCIRKTTTSNHCTIVPADAADAGGPILERGFKCREEAEEAKKKYLASGVCWT